MTTTTARQEMKETTARQERIDDARDRELVARETAGERYFGDVRKLVQTIGEQAAGERFAVRVRTMTRDQILAETACVYAAISTYRRTASMRHEPWTSYADATISSRPR